jgi:hypothetical protein
LKSLNSAAAASVVVAHLQMAVAVRVFAHVETGQGGLLACSVLEAARAMG